MSTSVNGWFLIVVLMSFALATGVVPATAQTPLRLTFPPCGGAPGITADPDGDKTFVRVVDSAGNDFEVRCHRGFASFNYEFWVSFPNGTRRKVDICELDGGLNDVVLHITGITTTATGANGENVITVGGTISKCYTDSTCQAGEVAPLSAASWFTIPGAVRSNRFDGTARGAHSASACRRARRARSASPCLAA